MRVYTQIVWQMAETGLERVGEVSEEYSGPVAQCKQNTFTPNKLMDGSPIQGGPGGGGMGQMPSNMTDWLSANKQAGQKMSIFPFFQAMGYFNRHPQQGGGLPQQPTGTMGSGLPSVQGIWRKGL